MSRRRKVKGFHALRSAASAHGWSLQQVQWHHAYLDSPRYVLRCHCARRLLVLGTLPALHAVMRAEGITT